MASRASYWIHPEGDEASVSALVAALAEHAAWLAQASAKIYDGEDFTTGIDLTKLKAAAAPLMSLCRIDPRGAIISQNHLSPALKDLLKEPTLRAELLLNAATEEDAPMTFDEACDLLGYKLRVMASHIRLSYDRFRDEEGHELSTIFGEIDGSMSQGDPQLIRRRMRLKKRTCPFIHFRDEPAAEDKEEEIIVISKRYDGVAREASLLLSDGRALLADKYLPCDDGFLQAAWHDPGVRLKLEVSNKFLLADGSIGAPEPKQPALKPKGKAAAKAKTLLAPGGEPKKNTLTDDSAKLPETVEVFDDEAAAALEGDDETASSLDGESLVTFKTLKGRGNKWTVLVQSTSRDKAQILQVGHNDLGDPEDLAKLVVDCLSIRQEEVEIELPVRGAKWLPSMRRLAQEVLDACIDSVATAE